MVFVPFVVRFNYRFWIPSFSRILRPSPLGWAAPQRGPTIPGRDALPRVRNLSLVPAAPTSNRQTHPLSSAVRTSFQGEITHPPGVPTHDRGARTQSKCPLTHRLGKPTIPPRCPHPFKRCPHLFIRCAPLFKRCALLPSQAPSPTSGLLTSYSAPPHFAPRCVLCGHPPPQDPRPQTLNSKP